MSFTLFPVDPLVHIAILDGPSFIGDCNREPPKRNLMIAYRQFGLHAMFMDELTPSYTCEDDRFSRDDLFHFGKTYPKPA